MNNFINELSRVHRRKKLFVRSTSVVSDLSNSHKQTEYDTLIRQLLPELPDQDLLCLQERKRRLYEVKDL